MNTSLSISPIDKSLNVNNANSINELKQAVQVFIQTQFTGCLEITVKGQQSFQANLFFRSGRLFAGDSSLHPVRRWCRQVAQYCPHLTASSLQQAPQFQYWSQNGLIEFTKQGRITHEQLTAVVEGNLIEILFDITQTAAQTNAEMRLTCKPLTENLLPPYLVFPSISRIHQQAQQIWQVWQESNLSPWSPNLAPVIWDAEELRQQMSFLAYHNLTLLADGDRTLRDIAIQLKQPLVPLTRSLSPYLQSRIVGLAQVGDWDRDRMSLSNRRTTPPSTTPPSTTPPSITPPTAVAAQARSTPLIAYIEDSRFDSVAMSQIVAQAGYRFINVRNPIEALPILLEQKPSLIFLDLLMPVTNGYEVCTQVRRISAFKDTPIIIVTSKDGIVDRVRAKLAGSSEFITKPIERDKVLSVLENYLKSY